MFSLFKPIPVYVKLYTDRVEVTRLDTGETIDRSATEKFSSARLVIADFEKALLAIRAPLEELLPRKVFQPSLHMVIQQMEKTEGGLSHIEKRALRDIGEMSGASKLYTVDWPRALTTEEALQAINE